MQGWTTVRLCCAYMAQHRLPFKLAVHSIEMSLPLFFPSLSFSLAGRKMVNQLKLQCTVSWRKVCPLPHSKCSCTITSISDVWVACPSAWRRPLSCDCVLFCWYNLLNKVLLFTFLNWSTIEKTWPLRSFILLTALELWRCFKLSFSVLQNILDERERVEVEWECYWQSLWQLYFMQSCKMFT